MVLTINIAIGGGGSRVAQAAVDSHAHTGGAEATLGAMKP